MLTDARTITQTSANAGLYIDHDANHNAISIDAENTTDSTIYVESDALTTGRALHIKSNSSSTGTRNLVEIHNDHTSATGTTGLKVQNDSTGLGIESLGRVKIKSDGIDEHGLDIRSVLYVHKADGTSGGMLGHDASENLFSFAANNSTNGMNFITHNGSSWGERLRIHTDGNVNIGSAASAIQATGLHVATGAPSAMGNITIESSSNATSPPTLHFAKARGSVGSRSAINTAGGDILGTLSFNDIEPAIN